MAFWSTEAVWRETNLLGVYLSPLVVYMLAAGLVYAPLRFLAVRMQAFRWTSNPPLAEIGIYICILGVLVVWF